jgi:TnpA family transposase
MSDAWHQADAAHARPGRRDLLPPEQGTRYAHIDALFTGDIDWDLIATHARDMIQVVLSIQAGRAHHPSVSSSSG